jgi:hypothetical protein
LAGYTMIERFLMGMCDWLDLLDTSMPYNFFTR